MFKRFMVSSAPRATVLIRLAVGLVFLTEGIQKFLFPGDLGVGRFEKIGLPSPGLLAPVVGGFEIVCGALVLIGLLTRLASVPLLAIIAVAIFTTKVPLFTKSGVWKMAHETRTDFAMLMGVLFLLIVGAGALSFDAFLSRKQPSHAAQS